jgi:hypothetical protein
MKQAILIGFAMVGVAALATVSNTAHGASASPGKTAVYASTTATLADDVPVQLLSGTIQKGKKKRVLEVEISLSAVLALNYADGTIILRPTVNGLAILEPLPSGVIDYAFKMHFGLGNWGQTYAYWVDLDAAEAAHPGMFIGQPLVIEVEAEYENNSDYPPASAIAALRARLQKK